MTRMADARAWAVLLRPLNAAMNNPLARDVFAQRCELMAAAMPDVPEAMLTGWRQQEALRRFKFFPSPAEMWEWLGPDLREERKSEAFRERLNPPRVPALKAPTLEPEAIAAAKAAVRASVQAFIAERNLGTAGKAEAEPVRQAYVSDHHLLGQFEFIAREGGPGAAAAALRVTALRHKLGIEQLKAAAE